MTEVSARGYYEDAYTTHFVAQVVGQVQVDGGPGVLLDRTYFYPTSGGQPHDTGRLQGIPVVDVRVDDRGRVVHVLAHPLEPGVVQVEGEIDWPRRYDHMQQHSGQHLLSRAFHRLFGWETVSVHFGRTTNTLDLAVPEVGEDALAQVEEEAYRLIAENRPIHAYWVDEERLAHLPLRRPPQVTGRIRIVEIQGYDWSACGGTHVRRTGEIGPVALLRAERHRGRIRVHFLCGRRAIQHYRQSREWLHRAALLLDTGPETVPDRVAALLARAREQERSLRRLQAQAWAHRAQYLAEQARAVGSARLLVTTVDDLEPEALKGLAQVLVQQADLVAVLGARSGGRATVILARGSQIDVDVAALARAVLGQHGGGGGGRPDFAQGGLPSSRLDDALAHMARQLAAHLHIQHPEGAE